MRNAVLGLRFLCELGALAALAYWGFRTGHALLVDLLLGLGAPLLFALAWARFAAPRAERRLDDPARIGFEVVVFGLAVAALAAADQVELAALLGVASLTTAVGVRAVGGEPVA
jgi:hypothetical protein